MIKRIGSFLGIHSELCLQKSKLKQQWNIFKQKDKIIDKNIQILKTGYCVLTGNMILYIQQWISGIICHIMFTCLEKICYSQ